MVHATGSCRSRSPAAIGSAGRAHVFAPAGPPPKGGGSEALQPFLVIDRLIGLLIFGGAVGDGVDFFRRIEFLHLRLVEVKEVDQLIIDRGVVDRQHVKLTPLKLI